MKIAVTFENGQVFQHFGHTSQFKIYEVENDTVKSAEVVDTNGSGHGALAGFLAGQGVDVVICGGGCAGFTAGVDCHAVVETMRGHALGHAIYEGCAQPNTNIPGLIGGFAGERVLRAPADGPFTATRRIGDTVEAGDTVGFVSGEPMRCTIGGVLRGLLADGVVVRRGMKAGDVDPRGNAAYCRTVSDKALAVGGGVLEAILHFSGGAGDGK